MLYLVGVGHVFTISEPVRRIILERRPQIVCVELDQVRYEALLHRDGRRDAPFLYRMLSVFQERIADKFGGEVGEEMLTAIHAAKEIGADIAFIDIVPPDLFKNLTLKEKIHLFFGSITALFTRKEKVEEELRRFEENTGEYMEIFEEVYPAIKKALIDDRDKHMAEALRQINEKYDSIVAVIGDGHIPGITRLLEEFKDEINVIRLSEIRGKV